MKKFYFKALFAACFTLLVSCTFNSTRQGMESDKKDGEKVADKLFGMIADHQYAETDKIFSEDLLKITPADSIRKMLQTTRTKLGEFKSNTLADWNTLDVSGTNERTEYMYVYDVKFEKYDAKVTLGMLRKGDEEDIKILRFNIDSPGFMQ